MSHARSLYVLDSKVPFTGYMTCGVCSPPTSPWVAFSFRQRFPLLRSFFDIITHLFLFASVAFVSGVKFTASSPRPPSGSLLPAFPSRSSVASGLTVKRSLHRELTVVHGVREGSRGSSVLSHVAVQRVRQTLLTRAPFPHCVILDSESYIHRPYTWGSISGLPILFH